MRTQLAEPSAPFAHVSLKQEVAVPLQSQKPPPPAPSPQPRPASPASVEAGQDLLLKCFQTRRFLLVLDNLEPLPQPHDPQGHYLPGYEDYGVLLRRVAETTPQSCLLLTSREIPADLV